MGNGTLWRLAALTLHGAMAAPSFAQAPAVTAVLNDASGDARLSPGVRAKVHYTGALPADGRHFPAHNETVFVYVGGRKALVMGAGGGGSATVVLPRETAAGPNLLVLTNGNGASMPFSITLDAYSPGLQDPGLHCPWGQPDRPEAVLNAVGLGPTDPPLPTHEEPGAFGQVPTAAKPAVTVAGRAAEVVSSTLVRRSAASYVVTYKVPAGTPEGSHPVTLTIGGRTSNTVYLLLRAAANRLATGGELSRAAPESIVSARACSGPLAAGVFEGDLRSPATELGGATVTVRDSAGAERPAPLYHVSPERTNYVVPAGSAPGPAAVTIRPAVDRVSTAPLEVDTVEPGLFLTGGYWWASPPAGLIVRVRDGMQTVEPIDRGVDASGDFVPVDLGPETDQVYLVLGRTSGWRGLAPPASGPMPLVRLQRLARRLRTDGASATPRGCLIVGAFQARNVARPSKRPPHGAARAHAANTMKWGQLAVLDTVRTLTDAKS